MTDILLSAFILSIVLLGIHSYFGLEIIKRGIIFTDLAIGQMAALGAAVSLLFFDGAWLELWSLSFALLGGGIVAVAAHRTSTHEAFIGLLYAFGLSAVYLILSQSSHGMETFQKLRASDILFTPYDEIFWTAGVYGILGVVIYFVYQRTSGFLKEAVFFVTFAVTVTLAVRLAGVLVVFALLVAPALIATKISKTNRLFIAWGIGTLTNVLAIYLSYTFDFPTGYTLVALHSSLALLFTMFIEKGGPKPTS